MSLFPKAARRRDRRRSTPSSRSPRTGTSGCARSTRATASRSSREPLALYRWGSESLSAAPARMDEHVEAVLRRVGRARRPDRRGARVPRAAALRARPRRARPHRRRGAARGPLPRGGRELPRGRRPLPERAAAASGRPARCALAPWLTGPLVRARQLRIERRVGFEGGARPVSEPLRVAFVCTGNRFRSPLAAALLRVARPRACRSRSRRSARSTSATSRRCRRRSRSRESSAST